MRIGILSDLHLSRDPLELQQWPWDVLVLAGDLGRPERAIAWARQAPCPTIFVAGNHEYYGSDLSTTITELKARAIGSRVIVLEKESVVLDGIRFLGCTLWSDFRPTADSLDPQANIALVSGKIRDFSAIRVAHGNSDYLTPAVSRLLFDQTVEWLEREFQADPLIPTVVVSHFAPSVGSIHASFRGSPLNPAFVSELADRIVRWRPSLWIHGHMHNSFDYNIGPTRVVCNPRGYVIEGVVENARFDPTLTVTVPYTSGVALHD